MSRCNPLNCDQGWRRGRATCNSRSSLELLNIRTLVSLLQALRLSLPGKINGGREVVSWVQSEWESLCSTPKFHNQPLSRMASPGPMDEDPPVVRPEGDDRMAIDAVGPGPEAGGSDEEGEGDDVVPGADDSSEEEEENEEEMRKVAQGFIVDEDEEAEESDDEERRRRRRKKRRKHKRMPVGQNHDTLS